MDAQINCKLFWRQRHFAR